MRTTNQRIHNEIIFWSIHIAWLYLFVFLIRAEYVDFADRHSIEQAKQWPSTTVQVVDFSSKPKWVRDGKVSSHKEYELLVRYRYKVDGVTHVSQQDKFLDYGYQQREFSPAVWDFSHTVSYRKFDEEQIKADYAILSKHMAKYDPANPAVSLIDTHEGSATAERLLRLIGFAALFVSAAIYLYIRVLMYQGDKLMEQTIREYPGYLKD